jgi:hypothetical protein
MRALEINFAGRGRGARWAPRVLLAVALVLALDMGLTYRSLAGSIAEAQARLAQAEPRSVPTRKVSPEEVAAARETFVRLARPWEGLFAALEAAANDEIALLGIEPDPKTGTVLISGDSKDYPAVLAYVLNLARTGGLSRVELVRHEVKPNDPQRAVAFSVSAGWDEARP